MSGRSFPSKPASRSRGLGGEGSGLPSSPARRPQGLPRAVRDRPDASRTTSTSTNSSSSGGASLLDRMKAPSSRTSLEDNREVSYKGRERGGARDAVRDARSGGDSSEAEPADQVEGSISGHGYDLWGRVTAVASKLTVNVNQAWQKSVRLGDGEETPPGGESRLTKAMKAYHLDRARSAADLPAWLFEDHERGVGSRTWNRKEEENEGRFLPDRQPGTAQGGGLREGHDRAAGPAVAPGRREGETSGGSRATDRLRAIRDAKRTAARSGQGGGGIGETGVGLAGGAGVGLSGGTGGTGVLSGGTGRTGVGLPAGPGRIKRSER